MKVLVCPDKFKGSLTARQVCQAIEAGIKEVDNTIEVASVPMADGGEGTLDVLFDCLNLQKVEIEVNDPLFRKIRSHYGIDGSTAFIEMATASGLQLLSEDERNALKTSSFGTGELIKDALDRGATQIYLFVGGSATNDGGTGMATALGVKFLDERSNELDPIGSNLSNITKVQAPEIHSEMELIIVTDVKNKLLGPYGAAHLYAPQKGATKEDVTILESGLAHLDEILSGDSIRIGKMEGSGAAGGMALTAVGLFHATINSGIESLLEITNLKAKVSSTDLVITGEGKMDEQTLHGKVIDGVAKLANKSEVKASAICGINMLSSAQSDTLNLDQILCVKEDGLSTKYCMENAYDLVQKQANALMKRYLSS